jgi:hypothetical protein
MFEDALRIFCDFILRKFLFYLEVYYRLGKFAKLSKKEGAK